jgi:hypothetical protein
VHNQYGGFIIAHNQYGGFISAHNQYGGFIFAHIYVHTNVDIVR